VLGYDVAFAPIAEVFGATVELEGALKVLGPPILEDGALFMTVGPALAPPGATLFPPRI